jgi:hypothetical protein
VLARLGHYPRSKVLLERAIEVAETTGDLEGAGRAKLSIIEELGEKIPTKELVSIYRSAIELLKGSQDPSTGKRLITCAGKLLDDLGRLEGEDQESREHTWEGFSFKQHVRDGAGGDRTRVEGRRRLGYQSRTSPWFQASSKLDLLNQQPPQGTAHGTIHRSQTETPHFLGAPENQEEGSQHDSSSRNLPDFDSAC